jgi:hypothetical protein
MVSSPYLKLDLAAGPDAYNALYPTHSYPVFYAPPPPPIQHPIYYSNAPAPPAPFAPMISFSVAPPEPAHQEFWTYPTHQGFLGIPSMYDSSHSPNVSPRSAASTFSADSVQSVSELVDIPQTQYKQIFLTVNMEDGTANACEQDQERLNHALVNGPLAHYFGEGYSSAVGLIVGKEEMRSEIAALFDAVIQYVAEQNVAYGGTVFADLAKYVPRKSRALRLQKIGLYVVQVSEKTLENFGDRGRTLHCFQALSMWAPTARPHHHHVFKLFYHALPKGVPAKEDRYRVAIAMLSMRNEVKARNGRRKSTSSSSSVDRPASRSEASDVDPDHEEELDGDIMDPELDAGL